MVSGNPKDRELLGEKMRKSLNILLSEGFTAIDLSVDDPEKAERAKAHLKNVAQRQIKYMLRALKNYQVEYRPIIKEQFITDNNQ